MAIVKDEIVGRETRKMIELSGSYLKKSQTHALPDVSVVTQRFSKVWKYDMK